MTDKERLELLQQKNPFASSSVSDPKEHPFPDVPSINKNVYDALIQLIRFKNQHPSMGLGALILGEAGEGKSHLVNRLLRNCSKQDDFSYMVAYIQPIEDPGQTFSYLLREIVTNLFYPVDPHSPFLIIDDLMAHLYHKAIQQPGFNISASTQKKITDIFQTNPLRLFSDIKLTSQSWERIEKKLLLHFSDRWPASFLRVLFHLRNPNQRSAVIDWLKCNTIDSESAKLIDAPHVKNNLNVMAVEQAARDMIKNISLLTGFCSKPLLVCFDRLENLDSGDKVKSFGRMIEFLVDDACNMIPIALCRGDLWDNVLRKKFNVHVTERLRSNMFNLEGCTSEQAIELIESRLTWAYNDPGHECFPFEKQDLSQLFSQRMINTRHVLRKTNTLLMHIMGHKTIQPISRQLMTIFKYHYQKVLNDFDRYAPERMRIRRALLKYFDVKGIDVQINDTDNYIDFTFSTNPPAHQKGMVIIDINNHHNAIGARLKRAINYLKKNKTDHAFYVRDERCMFPPPPRWKTTNDLLDQFKQCGGHSMFLNRNEAAQCYAITLMHYAIKEGDISIETSTLQSEKATLDHFSNFLQSHCHHEPFTLFKALARILKFNKQIVLPPKNSDDLPQSKNKRIMQKIIEYLRPHPVMTSGIEELLQYVKESNIQTNMKEMRTVIRRFNDRFVIHPSKNNTMIKIKKEWINAQP
ncbi:MAG: hypothetical protein HQK75_13895 [Candidatus Magnetomorum sp.]|nr:hypothetical protein [Candidatus Magnetomorum sp.]